MVQEQDSSHPTGVNGEKSDDKAVIRARDRKANAAIQMKVLGADWEDIAQVLGFPTPRHALIAVERALEKELRSESKDVLRKMVDRRLERLLRAAMPKAIDERHPEQMAAIGKAREIIADHRKLFGLDAPTEVSIYSPAEGEIEQWISEVVKQDVPELEEADIFEADWEDGEPDALQAG